MRKQANPTTIGSFVLGAIVLGLGTLIFVGSFNLFSKEITFISYFDESVNGLNVGAPVKYKGVPIGRVSDIRIRYNQSALSSEIPVFIKVDSTSLRNDFGVTVNLGNEDELARQISAGLRAQLELDSLLTGQLFIELNYFDRDKRYPAIFHQEEVVYLEIPTQPSTLAMFGTETTDLFAQLTSIPFEEIGTEMASLLKLLNTRLEALDTQALQDELTDTMQDLRSFINDAKLKDSITTLTSTLESVEETSDKLREEFSGIGDSVITVSAQLNSTLISIESVMDDMDTLLHPGAPIRVELREFLEEMSQLSRSLKSLIDYLDRNPDALIKGRFP